MAVIHEPNVLSIELKMQELIQWPERYNDVRAILS